jgi:alkylhydroperoxidase/carboxymuconolactone decarboxylase family protein YurZ
MSGGLPFHVAHAKELGATLEEVKSAVFVGLPLVGICLTEAFAQAIKSYQEI